MFVGAVPRQVVTQVFRLAEFRPADRVFVCCSGSFRLDLAAKSVAPAGSLVYGNDVSLLSCALGAALTGQSLAFVESLPERHSPLGLVAALAVALELLKFNTASDFGRKHREAYLAQFREHLKATLARLTKTFGEARLDGFFPGDFRDHAQLAIDQDGLILAFPPTYKAGYERQYRKLAEVTQWAAPGFRTWDPDAIGEWLADLRAARVRHLVITDRTIDGLAPVAKFLKPQMHPVFIYGDARRTSLRRNTIAASAFRYTPVDPAAINAQTRVELVGVSAKQFDFLRNQYLAHGIVFSDGTKACTFLIVMLDGMVAGGIQVTRDKALFDAVYIQSDFAVSRERKLSKLIAMLARTRAACIDIERRLFMRYTQVRTTAFTDKPVSMKYRGVFSLVARKPGALSYSASIIDDSPQEVFAQWLAKHGKP